MQRGKRELKRKRRWPWVLLAIILAAGLYRGYQAYQDWMDEVIWSPSQWPEGFSYWRTLEIEAGGDVGPALRALEEMQRDGPVQLKSGEEAAAFDRIFAAYGLESIGEYDFSESWLWVTGCVYPQGVWLEEGDKGLRAGIMQTRRGESRRGEEIHMGAVLENGLVICVTPRVELGEQG